MLLRETYLNFSPTKKNSTESKVKKSMAITNKALVCTSSRPRSNAIPERKFHRER